jgi:hypothetical protein
VVPPSLQTLFWDTRLEVFDPSAHPRYTIRRVLEHGDEAHVRWLLEVLPVAAVRESLRTDSRLSPRSATFWALVFAVPAADVAALTHQPQPVIPL